MSVIQSKNTPVASSAAAPRTDAQPNPDATPKPSGHAKPKPKPKPGKDAPKQLQPLHSYTGTVGAFAANPDGVLDRFQLETADKVYTVKFPPHVGQELRALAQPGREVAVLGFLNPTPKGDEHLHLARLDADGATARPLRRSRPPARLRQPPSAGRWPSYCSTLKAACAPCASPARPPSCACRPT